MASTIAAQLCRCEPMGHVRLSTDLYRTSTTLHQGPGRTVRRRRAPGPRRRAADAAVRTSGRSGGAVHRAGLGGRAVERRWDDGALPPPPAPAPPVPPGAAPPPP